MSGSTKTTAVLVGATGMVGQQLLIQLVDNQNYGAIVTLGRRAPDLSDQRLSHQVIDFADARSQKPVPDADVLFCCLGTTIKQAGSKSAFHAIDYELVVTLARQAAKNGTATFVVVSSVGADPVSSNLYLRTKGEMEHAVTGLGFERLGIMRPSLLLGARDEFRPAERIGQYAARLFSPLLAGGLARYRAVDAGKVAAAMIGFDQTAGAGERIVEGDQIRRLAGFGGNPAGD